MAMKPIFSPPFEEAAGPDGKGVMDENLKQHGR